MVDCLIAWSLDRLIDWLMIDWLVGWLFDGWMDGWMDGRLIDWSLDWLIDWLIDDWLVGWLVDCLMVWWMDGWMDGRSLDRLIAWSLDWLINWLIDWLIDWILNLPVCFYWIEFIFLKTIPKWSAFPFIFLFNWFQVPLPQQKVNFTAEFYAPPSMVTTALHFHDPRNPKSIDPSNNAITEWVEVGTLAV